MIRRHVKPASQLVVGEVIEVLVPVARHEVGEVVPALVHDITAMTDVQVRIITVIEVIVSAGDPGRRWKIARAGEELVMVTELVGS